MTAPSAWVNDTNAALLTDLYELTMLQAYLEKGLDQQAVFDLFVRRLPANRNYLIACGLDDVLRYLETLHFTAEALEYLASLGQFSKKFLDWLGALRFGGDVYAVAEGTPIFADEPILEVVAPLPQAQLVETFLLNQINFQTMIASKAARVVTAAAGRDVVEFGLRRLHGTDAGMKAARACFVAGASSTSNVLAGQVYGIPVTGTMAHSYIEAHDSELDAFRAFASVFPQAILLVDTYDTLGGVGNVVRLAEELGDDFQIRGVRLDSGDLAALARESRRILDQAGLHDVEVFASGSLDEYAVADLVAKAAPITGFGVGTRMGVSADAPCLDTAYKLVGYAGQARMKLSAEKSNLPGQKQVWRIESGSQASHDIIGLHDEGIDGRPLLVKVMQGGRRLPPGCVTLPQICDHAQSEMAKLPKRLLSVDSAQPSYCVELSLGLQVEIDRLRRDLQPIG
ncbi:MAG: nicotinate phosphoribosyltransferase [Planctomycetota bacterium]|nr:nicotinate phosphoribosyltransferase [Planctomycetota bacterium]MCZ6850466.1 nicotinate phosphoribosyltransferase [Planctomycetota bacterium]